MQSLLTRQNNMHPHTSIHRQASDSLSQQLQQHFSSDLESIPSELVDVLKEKLPDFDWNQATSQERRETVAEHDAYVQAALLWQQVDEHEQAIERWAKVTTPTALDLAAKEAALAKLHEQRRDAIALAAGELAAQPIAKALPPGALREQRQDRRLQRLRELGGDRKHVHGEWSADGQRGSLAALVAEEKRAGSEPFDQKSIVKDLNAAAAREHESKRGGALWRQLGT